YQADDGIRDRNVTGVQTCALPIWRKILTEYTGHGPHPTPPHIDSHAPTGYVCPFCGLVNGDVSDPKNRCALSDVIYQDTDLIVFVAVEGFGPRPGDVMISPANHVDALSNLVGRGQMQVSQRAREVASAMKRAWDPNGISKRQHNEPAGNLHVWHYHLHVLARASGHILYRQLRQPVDIAESSQ